MRRGYVNIGDDETPKYLHYRMVGSGPALVFLHASPMSSASVVPFMQSVQDRVTAIALDTPGYGYSDSLSGPVHDLSPYVQALERFRLGLGLSSMGVYGSATGAQIAIEYAKAHVSTCDYVILDNAADFQDKERERILDGYFPDLSVDNTGGHLAKTWGLALDQLRFFPWHDHSDEARLPLGPISPEVVQSMVLQFLQAGGDYDKAYRAAFANEKAERVLPITVPATIIRWQGSILKRYTDHFDKQNWPDNFRMQYCEAGMAARQQAFVNTVEHHASSFPSAEIQPETVPTRASFVEIPAVDIDQTTRPGGLGTPLLTERYTSEGGRIKTEITRPRFVSLNGGSVHQLFVLGEGTPWLLLHDIGSSSAVLKDFIHGLGRNFPVIAPDLPGHGATDLILDSDIDYIIGTSFVLQELLREEKIDEIKILAMGESAALAIELARELGPLAKQLLLWDPLHQVMPLNVEAKLDGTHLMSLWHELKNQELYFPRNNLNVDGVLNGVPNLDPVILNQRVIDLVQAGPIYTRAKRSFDAYPIEEYAKGLSMHMAIVRNVSMTLGDRSRRLFPDLANAEIMEVPRDTQSLTRFFNV